MDDFKFAFRQLLMNPGFTAVAVLTLALGIGGSTAIFSVVNGLMLKPLPYDHADRLVQVWESPKPGGQNPVSPGTFLDFREQSTLVEDFAAFVFTDSNFSDGGRPERIPGLRMSANGLHILRARPLLGRIFAPDEDQPGKAKVVVLTQELWEHRYAGDPDIVGRTVLIDDKQHTVVGVLPHGFLPQARAKHVVPYVFEPGWRDERGSHWLRVYARLKPGVAVEQGRAELAAIVQRNKALYSPRKKDWSATAVALDEQLSSGVKPALLVLLGGVACVLLIACANVANMLLAKSSARRKEIALRAALGATRGRIVRQLLVESILLAALGAAVGFVLAAGLVGVLRRVVTALDYARAYEVALDGSVLTLTLVLASLSGVIFGLAPALHASRVDLDDALKDAARGSAAGGNRLRGSLIIGEVALALVLLVGAGLLLNSFVRLVQVSPGFDPEHALTVQFSLSESKYPDGPRRLAFYSRLTERLAAIPGVEAAGLTTRLPLSSRGMPHTLFRIVGQQADRESGYNADFAYCTPDYFRALGIPLLRGRYLETRDGGSRRRVALINEAMASEYFPGEDPIGRHLAQDDNDWEIVGIVGNVRAWGLTQAPRPAVYWFESPTDEWRDATLVVRSHTPPAGLLESLRRGVHELDPAQPFANVRTLDEVVADSVGPRRLTLLLVSLFAGTALLLAAVGLYGVIAYTVSQRMREFGIRMALGARRGEVLALILRQGLRLVGIGVAFGSVCALGLTRFLATMLFEVRPTDPTTFIGVSLVLVLAALLASWLPARRAARVDPMVALRSE